MVRRGSDVLLHLAQIFLIIVRVIHLVRVHETPCDARDACFLQKIEIIGRPVPQRIAVMPDDRGTKINKLMRSQSRHHVRAIFVQKGQLQAQGKSILVPVKTHHKIVQVDQVCLFNVVPDPLCLPIFPPGRVVFVGLINRRLNRKRLQWHCTYFGRERLPRKTQLLVDEIFENPAVVINHEVQKLAGLKVAKMRRDPRFRGGELFRQALDLTDAVVL